MDSRLTHVALSFSLLPEVVNVSPMAARRRSLRIQQVAAHYLCSADPARFALAKH